MTLPLSAEVGRPNPRGFELSTDQAAPALAENPGPSIQVVLAAFNGARFLEQQLASLLSQTRSDFTILVTDDGSSDGTSEIVAAFGRAHPGRMIWLPSRNNVGSAANFSRGLSAADADVILLCDHDDVWLPDKIDITVQAMLDLEVRLGRETPLLVHTDAMVVDEDLRIIHRSLARFERLDPARSLLRHLLLGNVATGCTMAINRALATRALPVPAQAVMHDHWLALVATAVGHRSYLPEPTLLYRQHSGNAVGVKGWALRSTAEKIAQTLLSERKRVVLRKYSEQAGILLLRHGAEVPEADRKVIQVVAEMWDKPRLRRVWELAIHRVGLSGAFRRGAMFVAMLVAPTLGR